MRSTAQAAVSRTPIISFPSFDENRHMIIGCVEGMEERGAAMALPTLTAAYHRLRRVRNSSRHERLAEFLHHTITAIESDQPEGAKYILLTALATFGWPSDLTEAF